MTTLNLQVGASADDCKGTTTTGPDLTSTTLQAIGGASPPGVIGCRFTNVTIPNAETISAAAWQIKCASNDDTNGNISAHDTDSANTFSTSAPDRHYVADRTRTTASVSWNVANIGTGAFKDSPDITTVIQEIVDRAGWSSGNAIAIMYDCNVGGSFRVVEPTSYDGSTADAPKLTITYGSASAKTSRLALLGVN